MKENIKKVMVGYIGYWARLVLEERRPRIIGVTGSVGKTTTKEAIAAVLDSKEARSLIGVVGKSAGNLNTETGLPFSILRYDTAPKNGWQWMARLLALPFRAFLLLTVDSYPSVLILEYAADRPGDITYLTRLAQPEVAVVTAVGPAHLEKFKKVENVAQEKGQLVRSAWPNGLVVLAKENSHVAAMKEFAHAKVELVSGRGVTLSQNIARAIGKYFGLSEPVIAAGLKNFHSLEGRLQERKIGKWQVIDDTYNANPLSMELALDTLSEQAKTHQRKVAILGMMRELGDETERYHIEIGEYARKKADLVIGVGDAARYYKADKWFATSSDAAEVIKDLLKSDDLILVKGSRSVYMEKIVEALGGKSAHH